MLGERDKVVLFVAGAAAAGALILVIRRMRARGESAASELIALPPVVVPGTPITARQYISAATGLRAMLIQTDEPICSMQLVLATEADTNEWSHKDDGLPHTLEHLIFLGSDLFPYKGILDKLANRSMAQGTNAWTAVRGSRPEPSFVCSCGEIRFRAP